MENEISSSPTSSVYLAPDGGPGLEKTVIRPGVGPSAGNGSCVRLRYSMRLSGTSIDQAFDSSSTRLHGILEFTIGKRRVIRAMELIAASMSVGEECEVVCSPKFAFGSEGLKRKNVPPNSTIVIHVEMVSFEGGVVEKPLSEMSASERFAKAELFKEQGNKLFKETKYEKAVSEYSNAIRLLANIFTQPMVHPENVTNINTSNIASFPTTSSDSTGDVNTPGSNVDNVRAAPALVTDRNPPDNYKSDGYQEAEVVIDATSSEKHEVAATAVPNGESEKGNDNTPDSISLSNYAVQVNEPSESQVVSLHVRTLNNLSLCCFKLGQHASAEEGATLAIRLDEKNFKGFYYR